MMMVMKESGSGYSNSNTNTLHSKRLRQRRPEQQFSSYISFGYGMTIFLAILAALYFLLMIRFVFVIFPGNTNTNNNPPGITNNPKNPSMNQQPLTEKMRETLDQLRQKVSNNQLIHQVQQEINHLRHVERVNITTTIIDPKLIVPQKTTKIVRNGFMVLGMHRSGTSMLSGLLVTGFGYNVGGPLIGGAFDNEKGFFELIPVVLQNDEFLYNQHIDWSYNVYHYNYTKGIELAKTHLDNGSRYFKEGRKALQFLNNPQNTPYLQKDPRMCITLKTWLPLLNNEPAIIWTYRHPMEVSHSLMTREKSFTFDHAIRLWIVYNIRALQNSVDLCRIYTSNEEILNNPLKEVQRISDELTKQCHVPKPPNTLTMEQVNKFVDTTLQHNVKSKYNDGPIIERHGTDCNVHELVTDTEKTNPKYELEHKLYRIAMKLYCDMKSGIAYHADYKWPELE